MQLVIAFGALIAISVVAHLASTTSEERRERQEAFNRKTRWLWIPTGLILLALFGEIIAEWLGLISR